MAAKKRIDHPATVTLLILTDADTGRRVAVNSGYILTFTVGDRRDTTVFRFTNGETLTVEEDFMTVVLGVHAARVASGIDVHFWTSPEGVSSRHAEAHTAPAHGAGHGRVHEI